MVALLVLLTILMFLVADGVVLSMKARRAPASVLVEQNLVFAQDGGEPIEPTADGEQPVTEEMDRT